MADIVVLNLQGKYQPTIADHFFQVLAGHQAQILDIEQSASHEHFSCAALLSLADNTDAALLFKDVVYFGHRFGINVHIEPVSEDDYQRWLIDKQHPRYIVTLLAKQVTAHYLMSISRLALEHGLTIERMERLSAPVDVNTPPAVSCIELMLRGLPESLPQLRNHCLQVAQELDVDLAIQKDSVYRRSRRLVAFDMDSTLIQAEVIDELAKEAGVGDKVAAITEQAMRGELDFKASFAKRMKLLKGLDESVLAKVAERLQLTDGTAKLIPTLHKLGYKTAIISGGFTYFARYLQQKLGIDYVFANELEIVDGKLTGDVIGEVIDGQRKAALLQSLASQEHLVLDQVIAVGDGANDLPMLGVAGLGVAFRAKPMVKTAAKQSISTLGLDALLYLLGYRDQDLP
ncbi:phosphoserine phosphatase SerB [Zooshikella harenae]|uniref:Phosphoserine phosphatase n=1 Tax=Zooshikella harenae TaxID=2827238 RepID=A0ABS5ZA63_9GAMM|nr:phosphoserine phosphatase SerB [Zooshikella harenae]MBU2710879.1 phosphoserine phosphatase SerB [Zooshikella harenae]